VWKNNRRSTEPLPRFPRGRAGFFRFSWPTGVTFRSSEQEPFSSLGIPGIVSVEAADLFRGKECPRGKYSNFSLRGLFPKPRSHVDRNAHQTISPLVLFCPHWKKQLGRRPQRQLIPISYGADSSLRYVSASRRTTDVLSLLGYSVLRSGTLPPTSSTAPPVPSVYLFPFPALFPHSVAVRPQSPKCRPMQPQLSACPRSFAASEISLIFSFHVRGNFTDVRLRSSSALIG